jgi:hypothetical protein
MLIAKKAKKTLEDQAVRLEQFKNSREKRITLETVQECDFRLQQMKRHQIVQ